MPVCQVQFLGKKICFIAKTLSDCLKKLGEKTVDQNSTIVIQSESGFIIEDNESFMELCERSTFIAIIAERNNNDANEEPRVTTCLLVKNCP